MTKPQINNSLKPFKSKNLAVLEFLLLAGCLCVMVIRVVPIESLTAPSSVESISGLYSLSLSILLIVGLLTWFVWSFYSRGFFYRLSGIEVGLAIFFIGALIATLTAADKRAAITNFVTMTAPVLMALMLVQILDSDKKIRAMLYIIAGLGVVSAYWSSEQLFGANQASIEQYENNRQKVLEMHRIQDGSFKHMLFERMIYSKDVRGFFTTGNSAGSFALLTSFAAIALLLERIKKIKTTSQGYVGGLLLGFMTLIVLYGLAITKSKGAIAASIVAAAMFIIYLCWGQLLSKHKKAVLIIFLLACLAGTGAVVLYGMTHDSLPGGNSMLVRWQYWAASVKMYTQHPLTGVGPGNFANYYFHYKPAASPETIADPHCFLLAILTQYGPIGFIGFLAMIFIPLFKIAFASRPESIENTDKHPVTNIISPALFCACLGLLLHNLIDFAIFEPGILIAFWAILASLIALDCNRRPRHQIAFRSTGLAKIMATILTSALIWTCVYYAWLPVYQSGTKTRLAQRAAAAGRFKEAASLLEIATRADPLNADASAMKRQMYLQSFYTNGGQQENLLKAEISLLQAIERNRADFKNFELLTELYMLLAETEPKKENYWIEKAFHAASQAVERFDGCGRLRVRLAVIAEWLGKNDIALAQFQKAVEIEDSYRQQFKIMYPGEKIFSRLGENQYQLAKQRIKELTR